MSMNKKKRNILITVIIVAFILIAIPMGLYIAGNTYFSENKMYEKMWNITIPEQAKSLYNAKTPTSFHGDGIRYTIFNYDGSDSKFFDDFSNVKDSEVENNIKNILQQLDIVKEYQPVLTDNYIWQELKSNNDRLFILFDSNLSKLYFIQETT